MTVRATPAPGSLYLDQPFGRNDSMRVTLGTPGRIMPPADKAVEFVQQAEADGFDAVWWPCHLMGWLPDSVWTEEFTPLAKFQANPHVYFDPLSMMGAAGAATERIKVGVCVTDVMRRHPAMLAQQALTVDHLASGRPILGLGSGGRMNRLPYGAWAGARGGPGPPPPGAWSGASRSRAWPRAST